MPKTEVFVMRSERNISVLRINTFQESFARITQIQVLFKSKSNMEQILLLLFLAIRMGKACKAGPSSCWVPPGSAKPLVVKNTEAHADLYFFFFFIAKQLCAWMTQMKVIVNTSLPVYKIDSERLQKHWTQEERSPSFPWIIYLRHLLAPTFLGTD